MNRLERRTLEKRGGANGRLSDDPSSLARWSYRLAEEHYRTGKPGEAEKLYRRTLAADGRHVQSLHQLGMIAIQDGRFDLAIEMFGKVISLDARIPEAHNNLGLALQKQGHFNAALESCSRALELRPRFVEAHHNAGLALQQLDRHDEAIAHFKSALTVGRRPHVPQNLAISLQILGRHDEALAYLEAALAGDRDSADLHRTLGTVLLTLGRIDQARSEFRKAIELNPWQASSYFHLAETGGIMPNDPCLGRMERLAAETERLAPTEQVELHFALGKTLADIGEHTRSFQHYLAGNKLKRSQIDYDEAATLGLLERIRTSVTSTFLARHRGAGEPSDVPTFIVGMPRSGTTLVEQILAGHPEVFAAGERNDFAVAVKMPLHTVDARDSFLDHLDEFGSEQRRELGASYVAAVRATAPAARRITDKMPANFRFIGLIHAALPNATIIHVRRDPVDTCLSCFAQLFSGPQTFAYELGELGRYWKAYDRLMVYWRDILPDGVMLEVRYEDLVYDFEAQARRIVAHCGLEWHAACLTFYETERPVVTASRVQVRQPIYRGSVGRLRPGEEVLRPLLDALQPAAL